MFIVKAFNIYIILVLYIIFKYQANVFTL